MQRRGTPSVRVRSAKDAARGAPDRRVVKDSAECVSSWSSASEESGQVEGVAEANVWEEEEPLPYGEMKDDESRISGCREPYIAARSRISAKSLSDSNNSRRAHGGVVYSKKNVPAAVIEVTSASK